MPSKICPSDCRNNRFSLVENNYDVYFNRQCNVNSSQSELSDLNRLLNDIGDTMQEKCLCEDDDCKLYNEIKSNSKKIANFLDMQDSGFESNKKESCCGRPVIVDTCDCSDSSESEEDEHDSFHDICSDSSSKLVEIDEKKLEDLWDYSKKLINHFFTFSMILFLPVIIEIELFSKQN